MRTIFARFRKNGHSDLARKRIFNIVNRMTESHKTYIVFFFRLKIDYCLCTGNDDGWWLLASTPWAKEQLTQTSPDYNVALRALKIQNIFSFMMSKFSVRWLGTATSNREILNSDIDWVEGYLTEVCQRFFLRHSRKLPQWQFKSGKKPFYMACFFSYLHG